MKSVVEDDVFNVRIESENGNYEGEASQVLVLLSNYYADKKLFDENNRWIWKYLDFKRCIHHF